MVTNVTTKRSPIEPKRYDVQYGEEVNVFIRFSGEAVKSEDREKIEDLLAKMGIHFDRNFEFSPKGIHRVWEWDWSLNGPVSVRFAGKKGRP